MRVIIIGIDGVIGRALAAALAARGDIVLGSSRRPDSPWQLDLSSPEQVARRLPAADIAFFCAAIARHAECRADPALARQVNVTAPVELALRARDAGMRVVLLSTNAVYDGSMPRVPAAQAPSPKSFYGRLKAEAEAEFLRLGDCASVLRMTKVLTAGHTLLTGFITALAAGRSVAAAGDLVMAPITLQQAVDASIAIAARQDAAGLLQISASADITYADAARHFANRLGISPQQVTEVTADACGVPPEQVVRWSSLDTERLTRLTGFIAPDPFAVLDSLFCDAYAGARARGTAA